MSPSHPLSPLANRLVFAYNFHLGTDAGEFALNGSWSRPMDGRCAPAFRPGGPLESSPS